MIFAIRLTSGSQQVNAGSSLISSIPAKLSPASRLGYFFVQPASSADERPT